MTRNCSFVNNSVLINLYTNVVNLHIVFHILKRGKRFIYLTVGDICTQKSLIVRFQQMEYISEYISKRFQNMIIHCNHGSSTVCL